MHGVVEMNWENTSAAISAKDMFHSVQRCTYLLCRNWIALVHYLISWRRYLVYVLLWCYVLKMGQGRAGNSNKVYSRKSLYHIKPVLIGDGSIDTSNQILKIIKTFSKWSRYQIYHPLFRRLMILFDRVMYLYWK